MWRFWKRKPAGKVVNLSSLQIKPDCKYVIFFDRRLVARKHMAEAFYEILGLKEDQVVLIATHGAPKPAIAALEVQ